MKLHSRFRSLLAHIAGKMYIRQHLEESNVHATSNPAYISPLQVLLAALITIVTGLISIGMKLDLEWKLAVAAIRSSLRLALGTQEAARVHSDHYCHSLHWLSASLQIRCIQESQGVKLSYAHIMRTLHGLKACIALIMRLVLGTL